MSTALHFFPNYMRKAARVREAAGPREIWFLSLLLVFSVFPILDEGLYQAIPVSGMVVGNAMVATGLLFRQLLAGMRERRAEIEAKLCLGAPPAEAIRSLRRDCLRTAVQPTLDSLKTLGIVQLPGMMTGLILAGASPELAVKYQIMVAFMLAGTVSISTWLAAHLACRRFFNAAEQLDN